MNPRADDGFSLVELLIAASLMIVVLFATLGVMDAFVKVNANTTKLVESVDTARNAMGRLTRDLRDATAATTTAVPDDNVITRAESHDLVMRRINPFGASSTGNVTGAHTVRWCMHPNKDKDVLYRQVAAGVVVPKNTCPDKDMQTSVEAKDVANLARPVFTYDSTVLEDITSVKTFLALDRDPARKPAEATLESGVFLRNQNRRPVASFTYVVLGGRSIQLNAQPSRDPEGGMLKYQWVDNGVELPYTGAVASYVAPSDSNNRFITLTVTDVDNVSASVSQMVKVG